jgi:hypothetical protein
MVEKKGVTIKVVIIGNCLGGEKRVIPTIVI